VKVSRDVYDQLRQIRDREQVPIAVSIRLAVAHYIGKPPKRRGRPPGSKNRRK
jgi:hypothetical protein